MSDFATIADRSTLIFVRRLPGPIERVWAYLTDPKFLAKWFSIVSDRVGGEVRFEIGAKGRVTAYQPPTLLEYTWNEPERESACGPVVGALVRWELVADGASVLLTLTHSRLPENELLAHGAGWHTFLQRLSECIEGGDPQPVDELYLRFQAEYASIVLSAGIGTH